MSYGNRQKREEYIKQTKNKKLRENLMFVGLIILAFGTIVGLKIYQNSQVVPDDPSAAYYDEYTPEISSNETPLDAKSIEESGGILINPEDLADKIVEDAEDEQ